MPDAVGHPAGVSRRIISILTATAVLLAVTVLATVGAPPAFSAVPSTGGQPGGDPLDPAVPADAQEGYYIRVLLDRQVVLVYLDGEEIRSMVCSAGTAAKPTPTGRFFIQNRGEFFFSEKYQQGGKWWVSFRDWGIYLFHSVPTNRNGEIIPEEATKLGRPASHGCVRLSMADARWLYDTIPEEAPVDIIG
jgi:lipoprotein-anchoring transpeptidase ErfK/SrfK